MSATKSMLGQFSSSKSQITARRNIRRLALRRVAEEPSLTTEIPSRPAERREKSMPDFKLLSQPDPQGSPVEPFVTVEGVRTVGSEIGPVHRALNGSPPAGENHFPKLRKGESLPVPVVTQSAPAGESANHLLAEEARADLDRHADNHRSAGRHQAV